MTEGAAWKDATGAWLTLCSGGAALLKPGVVSRSKIEIICNSSLPQVPFDAAKVDPINPWKTRSAPRNLSRQTCRNPM